MAKTRLVLADAHQQMAAMVRQTLEEEFDEFEVVGTAEDGQQAINAVLTLNPDVLVIDMWMPALNGLEIAKQLQTANCLTKVIFLSIYACQSRRMMQFTEPDFSGALWTLSENVAPRKRDSQ